jgi:hypothetical protein
MFLTGIGSAALATPGFLRPAQAQISGVPQARFENLVAAYPDLLSGIRDGALVWKDGARMALDDGIAAKTFEQMLRNASITDQLRQTYRRGQMKGNPGVNESPGRIRNEAFFAKMYGDCNKGEVSKRMRNVRWMPKTKAQNIQVTTVNDVAGRLERIIAELEGMPDRFKAFLVPSAGTYNCRVVADTGKPSMHASGAAIDIATAQTDYWVWARGKGPGAIPYRNKIPLEIVEVFEKENFIWGGKWYHYDTMHFEYRPEMFES